MLDQLSRLVNDNSALVRRGRRCDVDFVIGVGDDEFFVSVRAGRVAVDADPVGMRGHAFAIRASAETWARFWRPVPEPGYHDIFAMTKSGAARIEGDWLPLMTHLRYFKDVLAAPRALAAEAGR